MLKFLLKIAANSAAIYIASNTIDGFTFSGSIALLAALGAGLAVFQTLLYPVIKTIAFPLVFLSFGLFGVMTNAVILFGIAYFLPQLTIEGIVPLALGTIILTMVNLLFSWL